MPNTRQITIADIAEIAKAAETRIDLITQLVELLDSPTVLELGVWHGEFAKDVLERNSSIKAYYMLDPWRTLDNWNKPFNIDAPEFEKAYKTSLKNTEFAAEKRIVLRGTTLEVIDQIEDESLDLIYIDGDHTLRGICIDLISVWPKLRPGGIIVGDDFSPTIWQHSTEYEPTFVYPFAQYFAEAHKAPMVAAHRAQFVIIKPKDQNHGHHFLDVTGLYRNPNVLDQITNKPTKKKPSKITTILKKFGLR
ncbi:class I SAM-dependent methyltransferase [Aliiroseovarius sp. F47248L]|uniref:class I SAM-dependent methyltransferase n=1 Tax=Aliiroseovarius sp. F47248L TaxID=2926420 RepID=UPI001FF4B3CC|nr:class I SAM-dependent methyltransferase [Aliiroseovarius sp. F47248L]MCK0139923.1 class I SAM-dependent methyltransferase [Aliiroseovarius sp. F47248L]